jgi:hypothetical protein
MAERGRPGRHRVSVRLAAEKEVEMPDVSRISVQEARERARSGQALLVCAYEQEEKCNQVALDGSISLTQFQQRLSSLPKEQELIFFCA